VIVLWLLHVLALATLPLLLAYFWNIKTIPVLAAGREGEENFRRLRYNPFKQYHALYQLIEAKKEAADQKYKDFSYGFWLFIPLFIFNPIGLNAFVLLLLASFWPFILQLRLIYQFGKQENSNRMPFILMLFVHLI
jgi:hypothetical protein